MSDQSTLVPFGKYKGQPVEALSTDPDYLRWLENQPWAREKFSWLINAAKAVIVLNVSEEEPRTPEHNRMQARFLDKEFCRKFFESFPGLIRGSYEHREEELRAGLASTEKELQYWDEVIAKSSICKSFNEENRENRKKRLVELKEQLSVLLAENNRDRLPNDYSNFRVSFEENNWDVVLYSRFLGTRFYIECKPCVGDDYSGILRKIKSRHTQGEDRRRSFRKVLFFKQFSSSAISEEDLREMFGLSGVDVLRMDEDL